MRAQRRRRGSALTSSIAPSRGGSISTLSSGPSARDALRRRLEQVGGDEARAARRGRCARRWPRRGAPAPRCPRRRRRCAPRRAIGSVKLPSPQKKSATRSPGRGSSSAIARRTSTRLIAGLTCVNSVGANGKLHAELGQRVARARVAADETGRRVAGPPGCSQNCDAMAVGEAAQRALRRSGVSGSRMRSTSTSTRSCRRSSPHRELDLRQRGRGSTARRPARAARAAAPRCARGSTAQLRHVGDVARLPLVEADQHAALLRHVAHRQPRAVAVAPRRSVDRRQHLLPARTRPMCHSASSSTRCLAATCARGVEVLQRAAAADAEVRAARRRRARRSRAQDVVDARDLVGRLALQRSSIATRSPGSAPSTKIALPSMRATPRPSWSSAVMTTVIHVRAGARRESGARARIVPSRAGAASRRASR